MPLPERKRVTVDCSGGRTKQNHKMVCDINSIVAKANKTGMLPRITQSSLYGDFTGVLDYQTCLTKVKNAQEAFDSLDSGLRTMFQNDPARLIEFVSNEQNRQKAIELGLVDRPVPDEPPELPEPT